MPPTDADTTHRAYRPSQHPDAVRMAVPDKLYRRAKARRRAAPLLTARDRAVIEGRRARRRK